LSLRGGFFDRREKNPTKQSVCKIKGLLRQIELPSVVRFSSQGRQKFSHIAYISNLSPNPGSD
jgi:hypothetical protein